MPKITKGPTLQSLREKKIVQGLAVLAYGTAQQHGELFGSPDVLSAADRREASELLEWCLARMAPSGGVQ